MKREHKIGITVTCTFLCLAGAVIGLKMQEKSGSPPSEKEVAKVSQHADPEKDPQRQPLLNLENAAGGLPPADALGTDGKGKKSNPKPPPAKPVREPRRTELTPSSNPIESGAPSLGGDPPPKPPTEATSPESPLPGPFTSQERKGERTNEKETKGLDKENSAAPEMSFDPTPKPKQPDNKSTDNSNKDSQSKPEFQTVSGGRPQEMELFGSSKKDEKNNTSDKKADPNQKENKKAPFLSGQSDSPGGSSNPATDKLSPNGMPLSPPARSTSRAEENKSTVAPFPPSSPVPPTDRTPKPPVSSGPPPIAPPSSSILPPVVDPSSGTKPLTPKPDESSTKDGFGGPPATPIPLPGMSDNTADRKPEKKDDKKIAPISPMPIGSPSQETSEDTPKPAPGLAPTPKPPVSPSPLPSPGAKPLPPSGSVFEADPHSSATPPGGASPGTGPSAASPAPLPMPDSSGIKPTPSASAPDAPKPLDRAAPQVIVFNEQEYVCQPNDTFKELSKRFFSSEKYADALQRHNQNHARASAQMANSGKLTPGERIFIPPADILDQRYPDAIERSRPTTGAVPASFTAPGGPPAPPPPPAPDDGARIKPVAPIPATPAPASPTPIAPPSAPPGTFPPSPNP
ncbi:MAG TPA: hypothetical protein VH643_37405 [Gemmataceae bacterium]|jgi:hypothetical protein